VEVTSPLSLSSSSLFYTYCPIDSHSSMYFVDMPKLVSIVIPIALHPSAHALFCMYNFIYCSKGYIHRLWTWPQSWSSSTKCTSKCVMESKKEGRNSRSCKQRTTTTSLFMDYNNTRSSTSAQIFSTMQYISQLEQATNHECIQMEFSLKVYNNHDSWGPEMCHLERFLSSFLT